MLKTFNKLASIRKNTILTEAPQHRLMSSQTNQKDYYQILGIKSNASDKEVKDAYREMAKKYHPDVNTTGELYEPNVIKFRDVSEAYSILSIRQSRLDYDLSRKKVPDSVYQAEKMKVMEQHRNMRDKSGNFGKAENDMSGYESIRKRELADERKRYGVSSIGFYKGGLPRKDKGYVRGDALGPPNYFHDPAIHNYLNYEHPDTQFVTGEDAMMFKHYMNTDRSAFDQTFPWYPNTIDKEWKFMKERSFFLQLLIGFFVAYYAVNKFGVERSRMQRYEREHQIEDLNPDHFVNRGGVLIKKRFDGFQKYFDNDKQMMEWYKMAYPVIFENAENPEELMDTYPKNENK